MKIYKPDEISYTRDALLAAASAYAHAMEDLDECEEKFSQAKARIMKAATDYAESMNGPTKAAKEK